MAKRGGGLTKIKYDLSPKLEDVIGRGPMTRPQVTKKIWAYIKKHKLQNKTNRRQIDPDRKLEAVTGSGSFDMMKLAGKLTGHLEPV